MEELKILIVDRLIRPDENVVKDVFFLYQRDFDLIVFPPKQDSEECLIQVVSFKSLLRHELSQIFNQQIDYEDEDDEFYDFDLEEIELDTFYDMLNQSFEVLTYNLTSIERKTVTL